MIPTADRPIADRIAFTLLWLFVFTIPLTYATELPMVGAMSRAAGLAAIAAVAIAVALRRNFRLLGPLHLAMAGFILWSAVTLYWSIAPALTIQRITTYLQLFVLVLMLWEMCTEEKDILRLLGAFVLGAIVPSLSTVGGFLPGQQILLQRASAPGYDPNQLAFLLALSLPAAYYLVLRQKGPVTYLYRLQIGFSITAILLTGSAGAMVAMAVGLSLVCWTFHTLPIRTRTNGFVAVAVLAGSAFLFLPTAVWQGIAEQAGKGDLTLTSAVTIGTQSIHTTPIGGFGAGTGASGATANNQMAHSVPFTLFAETGVIGVLCFLAMLGGLFFAAEGMSSADKSFWLTSLAVWVVGAYSLSWDCSQPAWLIFGLLAAHSGCLNAAKSAKETRALERTYGFEKPAEAYS